MATRTWLSKRAGTSGHQWSAPSTDTLSPWYDGTTQTAFADYPGSNPATNLDIVSLVHAVTLDTAVTLGLSLQAQATTILAIANTGTPTTFLATGVYKVLYTTVSAKGESGYGQISIELTTGTLTRTTSTPRITFPNGAPPSGCTYNLYLTQAAGGSGTERLFCTGITGATVDLQGANSAGTDSFWGNTYAAGVASGGSTAFASAAAVSTFAFPTQCALQMTASGNLTMAANLTLRGDFSINSIIDGLGQTVGAGFSFILDPSLATDRTRASYVAYYNDTYAEFNGTSGSHCVMKTNRPNGDEARAYIVAQTTSHRNGIRVATYTDFTDLGDTVNWGVGYRDQLGSSTTAVSITNCTFLRSSFQLQLPATSYDGNITFQNNRFTSSIGTIFSAQPCSALLSCTTVPSTGVRLIDSNSFDQTCVVTIVKTTITNNVFQKSLNCFTGTWWPDDSYFNNNMFYYNDGTDANPSLPGPARQCYFYDSNTGNPHMIFPAANVNVTTYGLDRCVIESAATTANGEVLFPGGTFPASSVLTVTRNIIVPASNGLSPCALLASVTSTILKCTLEHNTVFGHQESTSLVYYGEGAVGVAGILVSVRGNLIADIVGTGTSNYVVSDINGTHTADCLAVPNGTTIFGATNNGIYGGTSSTITANNVSQSCVGYNGIKVSTAGNPGSNGNTQVGLNDVFGGNPGFVAPTRNLASWGGTAAGGGVATVAGAVATLAANPALIAQATTGLLAWVRAGYRFTNTAYRHASYAADASTIDANGNAWGGVPDIGAMAFLASAGPPLSFRHQTLTGGFPDMGL